MQKKRTQIPQSINFGFNRYFSSIVGNYACWIPPIRRRRVLDQISIHHRRFLRKASTSLSVDILWNTAVYFDWISIPFDLNPLHEFDSTEWPNNLCRRMSKTITVDGKLFFSVAYIWCHVLNQINFQPLKIESHNFSGFNVAPIF